MANEIYSKSWWGSGVCNNSIGWGIVYKAYAGCDLASQLLFTLQSRAAYYENATCSSAILTELENIQ